MKDYEVADEVTMIQEAHPLKQGLKLSLLASAVKATPDSRGASTKTRIETQEPEPNKPPVQDSRGASTKTRIETSEPKNHWGWYRRFKRRIH